MNKFLKGSSRKYVLNTFWMSFEKFTRLLINLFVGVWLARYLGPSQFGVLNFGIAISTVLLPIVSFGLQGILVKELFNKPEKKNIILGTSFVLKTLLALVCFLGVFFLNFSEIYTNDIERRVVFFTAISLLFQPFLVIESWYESQAKAKRASIIKTLFFCGSSLLKIFFIIGESTVLSFAVLYSLEALFVALALVISYSKEEGSVIDWKFNFSILKDLTSKSWLLVLSSISAVIYLKIDQIMVGSMASEKELGLYSAAVRLSEAWYFIPTVLSSALFPAILEAKNKGNDTYLLRLQQLCNFFFIIAFILAIVITFISDFVINLLYGEEYEASSIVLKIHIWSAIFVFLRTVLSKWLIAEEKYKFSFISQVSGAVANVILNFLLIPKYGGIGAAVATVISYSVTSIFILGLFKDTKIMFDIFVKSFFYPIRVLFDCEKIFKKN